MGNQVTGLLSPFLRRMRIEAVHPHLRGRTLDFGCGIGMMASLIHTDNYLGIDSDLSSIEEARKLFPKHIFLCAVDFDPQAHKASFDTIVALAVIEHLPNPEVILCELGQLLTPQGRIVLTTPHPSMDFVHRLGSQIGLFSQEANQEHEKLFNFRSLSTLANQTNFKIITYYKFLGGVNQLCILTQK